MTALDKWNTYTQVKQACKYILSFDSDEENLQQVQVAVARAALRLTQVNNTA